LDRPNFNFNYNGYLKVNTNPFANITHWLTVLVVLASMTLSSCAVGPRGSYHTFTFDGWFDKWAKDVDLLAYDYGSVHSMVKKSVAPEVTTIGYRTSVNATMPNGEYLYVKWRIKSTGEVVEDKVDLRNLLPHNMFNKTVTFVIDGRLLRVYLVTPEKKRTATPILETWLSEFHTAYEIYPYNTFTK
jgi:hypothetical protein